MSGSTPRRSRTPRRTPGSTPARRGTPVGRRTPVTALGAASRGERSVASTPKPKRARSRSPAPAAGATPECAETPPLEALAGKVRVHVQLFCDRLIEFRRASGDPAAVPSQYGSKDTGENALYQAMHRLRSIYNNRNGPPFTAEEGSLLARLPGALGKVTLGHVLEVAQKSDRRESLGRPETPVVWRWSFEAAGYPIHSEDFSSEGEAAAELRLLQRRLYPEWCETAQRKRHLERWRDVLRERRLHTELMADPRMQGFVSSGRCILPGDFVPEKVVPRLPFPGFRNLGNTCYLNALLQCLCHCSPINNYLTRCDPRSSVMGECVRGVLREYVHRPSKGARAAAKEVIVPTSLLKLVLTQRKSTGGKQEDAAEVLECIFQHLDKGAMQRDLCATGEGMVFTGIVHLGAAERVDVSGHGPPVSMAALFLESLTGEQALRDTPPVLVLRVEPLYRVDGEAFRIDARAEWPTGAMEFTVAGAGGASAQYNVAAYVSHRPNREVEAVESMRAGHYVAYICSGERWYEADDASVVLLQAPPDAFPYLVFLVRDGAGLGRTGLVEALVKKRCGQAASLEASAVAQERRQDQAHDRPRLATRSRSGHAQEKRGSPVASRGASVAAQERGPDRAPGQPRPVGRPSKAPARYKRDRSGREQETRTSEGLEKEHSRTSKRARGRPQSGRARSVQEHDPMQSQEHDRSRRTAQVGSDQRVARPWSQLVSSENRSSDNRDHSRLDDVADADDPCQRYQKTAGLRRTEEAVRSRVWSEEAVPLLPQPCRLCQAAFATREEWEAHVDAVHGGLQRYRNAHFSLVSIAPYVVSGQELRAVVGNFAEFYSRSAKDWQGFTEEMHGALDSEGGLVPGDRFEPRHFAACVACARKDWAEDLPKVYLAGAKCFMQSPKAVCQLLSYERYAGRWPLIPKGELRASCVDLPHGVNGASVPVLLHKRRVNERQAAGEEAVHICVDCHEAFAAKTPRLCKYALANDMWLGRWDPLFREANLSHQMLLALARVVSTKVVLRGEGNKTLKEEAQSWDYLFNQAGMIGSAIIFPNTDCKTALEYSSPKSVSYTFAVAFVASV